MKATDIVDKFKKILLSETEEVKEIEVQEEVQLAEEEVIEEVKDEVSDEIPVEEVEKEDLYATKEELSKAIAEVKVRTTPSTRMPPTRAQPMTGIVMKLAPTTAKTDLRVRLVSAFRARMKAMPSPRGIHLGPRSLPRSPSK